jgi:hypothetical protein
MDEFSTYTHDVNGLTGFRSTRFLQLPYPITVTLMGICIMLHWLVSEALFVGGPNNSEYLGIYWSPCALLLIGLITLTLLIAISILYVFPFPSKMPVMAGSGQVVLNACCQLESPMLTEGVQWGDISTPEKRIAGFGGENMRELIEGMTYPSVRYPGSC